MNTSGRGGIVGEGVGGGEKREKKGERGRIQTVKRI